MTALCIIGAIAVLIAAVLAISITVYVSIKEDTVVKIGILFYKKTVYPETSSGKKNKKKKKAKPAKAKKTVAPNQPKKKKDIGAMVNFAVELLTAIFPNAKKIIRHIRITAVSINISVGKESADETAIAYGEVAAGVYNALALIDEAMILRVKNVNLSPDFVRGETTYDVSFKAKIRIGRALREGVLLLFATLKIMFNQNSSKATANASRKATSPNKRNNVASTKKTKAN